VHIPAPLERGIYPDGKLAVSVNRSPDQSLENNIFYLLSQGIAFPAPLRIPQNLSELRPKSF
jgi:hypothetical protein